MKQNNHKVPPVSVNVEEFNYHLLTLNGRKLHLHEPDMITEKIISILKDKKEKRYSIIPGTKEKCPYASVEIPLGDIFRSEEELTFYTGQKELKER